MFFLFNEFICRPLYNLLVLVYDIIPFHDFGLAIIIVTLLIKFMLFPLSRKQIESQKKMQEAQPKIKEIQEKYKNDKAKQSRAVMEFYKQNKTNPFSGCLPTIFQLVFLIAIYRVLFNISQAGLRVEEQQLYSFVANPGQINQYFLGLIDLSKAIDLSHLTFGSAAQIALVISAAAAQYFQTKMLMPKKLPEKGKHQDISQIMSKQMLYLGPFLTLFIGIRFPSGLALYWLVSTILAILQQFYMMKNEKLAKGGNNT